MTHILVIEPNDITRKLIVGILSSKGHATADAATHDDAAALLLDSPALVLMDVEENAEAAAAFIRQMHEAFGPRPLVVMTADRAALDADHAALRARLGVEALSVLEKPVMPDQLLKKIDQHLGAAPTSTPAPAPAAAATAAPAPAAGPARFNSRNEDPRAPFMRRAIDLSQQKMDENCGGPFGAVIVKDGKIIAEGWNEVTSTKDPTAHAEVQAIRKASQVLGDYALSGCEIYTSCEPCPMCLAAIYWARLDRIFFANTRKDAEEIGFDDDFIYREFATTESKRSLPAKVMMRDEAQIVFQQWMKKTDKTEY